MPSACPAIVYVAISSVASNICLYLTSLHCSLSMETSKKRKRVVLSIKEKIEICDRLEKGDSRTTIMKEYNIGSSTIYDIKSKARKLRDFMKKSESTLAIESRHTLQQARLKHLDKVLYEWFCKQRSEGARITGPLLQEKAKEFTEKMNFKSDCKFSDGWLARFKIRHGIRRFDLSDHQKAANRPSAEEFKEKFAELVDELVLTPEQIYNASETGLLYRCLPASTLACKGTVAKLNKDRLTVLMCANMAGTHKLKLCVIGKNQTPPCFKNLSFIPVDYRAQSNALLSSEIFLDWFRHAFVPAVKENLLIKGLPEHSKVVLLLDNYKSNPPAQELVVDNVYVLFVPRNVTGLIQPIGEGFIQNFKLHYRRNLMRKLLAYEGSVADFQENFNVKNAVFMASLAWGDVQQETLQQCWRNLYRVAVFLPKMEGNEFDGIETVNGCSLSKEIIDLVVRSGKEIKVRKKVIDEWLQVDKNVPVTLTINDEDIMEFVLQNQYVKEDLESDEEEQPKHDISWSEAAKGLSTFISFAEQSTCMTADQVMSLHIIENDFLNQKCKARKCVTASSPPDHSKSHLF